MVGLKTILLDWYLFTSYILWIPSQQEKSQKVWQLYIERRQDYRSGDLNNGVELYKILLDLSCHLFAGTAVLL